MPLRKSELRRMKESRNRRKLAPSRISFSENISWIVFATDMRDRYGPPINPFTRDVLFQLDVTIAF